MKKLFVYSFPLILCACTAPKLAQLPWMSNDPKPTALAEFNGNLSTEKVRDYASTARPDSDSPVQISPVVTQQKLVMGDHKGHLRLFNTKTGELTWQMKVNEGIETTPTLSDDAKHVALIDKKSTLRVYSIPENRLVFRRSLNEESYAQPLLQGNKVIAKTLSGDISVYDFHLAKMQWHYAAMADDVMVRASSRLLIDDDKLISGFSDGRIMAFNLRHGNVLWEQTLTDLATTLDVEERFDIVANPVADSRAIYVASFDGQVAALDKQNGQKLWQQSIATYKNFVVSDDMVYVVAKNDVIHALDKRSGVKRWQQRAFKYRKLSAPVQGSNWLAFYDESGYLHCLDKASGKAVARLQLSKPLADSEIAAADNRLFLTLANGSVTEVQIG